MDLIIVPFHDYKKWKNEGFRTRDAHLFTEFKKNEQINKILVINRPVSLIEMIIKRKGWKTKIGKKVAAGNMWQLNCVDEKTYFLDIFSLDIFKVIIQRKKWWNTIFNSKRIISIINKSLNILEMKKKILFLENPMAVGLINKLDEEKFAFDAIDNWLYHPQMSKMKKLVENNYNFIAQEADIIFTVSESLKEYFGLKNKNVYWIPNGVDAECFKKAHTLEKEKLENPSIGYMGKIQDRVDFELVEECLKKYKENKFIIMGPIFSQKEKIEILKSKYSNVEFTGDIHYDLLPEKMKKFDIAIIPHKVDKFTNSMNPLKIYEYLAAGKQIVTTKIAGAEEFSKYVYQAKNNDEFIEYIQKAIEEYKNNKNLSLEIEKLLNKENYWEYKANQIINKFK